MLERINQVSGILWDLTKFLALFVAISILTSMLFGPDIPFFGGILENIKGVIDSLGSEGLGLIIAIIIIESIYHYISFCNVFAGFVLFIHRVGIFLIPLKAAK